MKNRRALMFSVLCGFAAVVLSYYYISQKEKFYSEKFEEVPVLVATKDIQRYEPIDETMLGIRRVPKPFVQPLALTAVDRSRLVGYLADSTIKEGEQVTETKIARPGESRISILVPKEERGCTVAVDEISGVAGLIRPGDHVDIVGTFKTVDEKTRVATEAEAVTLLQNIPVLAVGRNYSFDTNPGGIKEKGIIPSSQSRASFSNVTFSVTPRQCMDLAIAQQVGVLTLTLRSYYNRFGGKTDLKLKKEHSTASSVTGITNPMEIGRKPKWLELRGDQAIFSP